MLSIFDVALLDVTSYEKVNVGTASRCHSAAQYCTVCIEIRASLAVTRTIFFIIGRPETTARFPRARKPPRKFIKTGNISRHTLSLRAVLSSRASRDLFAYFGIPIVLITRSGTPRSRGDARGVSLEALNKGRNKKCTRNQPRPLFALILHRCWFFSFYSPVCSQSLSFSLSPSLFLPHSRSLLGL